MSRAGQAMIEHLLVLGLVLMPLFSLGVRWGWLESERSRCALRAFLDARNRLIREDREVPVALECGGGIHEEIRLKPLAAIAGREPKPWEQEVGTALSLWAPLWSSSPSSPERDSGTSSFTSAPSSSDRLHSIVAPGPPRSGSATFSGLSTRPATESTPD